MFQFLIIIRLFNDIGGLQNRCSKSKNRHRDRQWESVCRQLGTERLISFKNESVQIIHELIQRNLCENIRQIKKITYAIVKREYAPVSQFPTIFRESS